MRAIMMLTGLALATGPLHAQDACGPMRQVAKPPIGSWMKLNVVGAGMVGGLRMAAIGTEKREGKEMFWLEMQVDSKQGQMTAQTLYGSYPPGDMGEDIKEMVMKAPGQPAMKLSGPMLKMASQMAKQSGAASAGLDMVKECKDLKLVGAETVTVPAGTFKTQHYQSTKKAFDVWIDMSLPFGMVKASGADEQGKPYAMELAAKGSDAKSSITEKPMDMGGMGGMMMPGRN
ncbi:MAG: hypothetical protein NW201_10225 [Gemmatimonadales bacterium]|nr:hypothetical protein [Gemmatimonadales bacterium]